MINGIGRIAITKLDVLDSFDTINVCVGYEERGKRLKSFPTDVTTLERVTPVYERPMRGGAHRWPEPDRSTSFPQRAGVSPGARPLDGNPHLAGLGRAAPR